MRISDADAPFFVDRLKPTQNAGRCVWLRITGSLSAGQAKMPWMSILKTTT